MQAVNNAFPTQPRDLLTNFPRRLLRDICKRVDAIRESRARNGRPDWEAWCFLPHLFWWEAIEEAAPGLLSCKPSIFDQIVALGTWRATQGVYRFDPTLYGDLIEKRFTGPVPAEAVFTTPEWSVYIEAQNLFVGTARVHGAFVHLDWDVAREIPVLCILLHLPGIYHSVPIELDRRSLQQTLDDLLSRGFDYVEDAAALTEFHSFGPSAARDALRAAQTIVSLFLYLCAKNADLGDGRRPQNPIGTRTRHHGIRLFPPEQPRVWDVGVRHGTWLRGGDEQVNDEAANDGERGPRARPRAHTRRGHLHWYWTGPRDAEKPTGKLKWLPCMLINADSAEQLPTTLRSVTAANEPYAHAPLLPTTPETNKAEER